jgi:hypothetical protein
MMNLNIEIPKNLVTEQLLKQKNIPCFCKVSKDFEISFRQPEATGNVSEWDRKKFEERAIAGAGGKYTHYTDGMITLREIGVNQYKIVDLALFYHNFGWCQVLENEIYAVPKNFWDEE